eukprot:3409494-Amphidinium_carterae.1
MLAKRLQCQSNTCLCRRKGLQFSFHWTKSIHTGNGFGNRKHITSSHIHVADHVKMQSLLPGAGNKNCSN